MIAKKYRMKEWEVQRAMKKGRAFGTEFFTIVIFPNRSTDNHRFGVVVSNKHTKSAVIRNAFRRNAYDTIAPWRDEGPVKGAHLDVIMITKKGIKLTKEQPEKSHISSDLQTAATKLFGSSS